MSDSDVFNDPRIEAMMKTVTPRDHERVSPPPDLWQSLSAEAGVAGAQSKRRQVGRFETFLSVAAMLTFLALGGVLVTSLLSGPGEMPVAEVALLNEGLPVVSTATGTALLVETEDGYVLDIQADALPDPDAADLELWVINGDVTDMHSLGIIDGPGRYPLPVGADPETFPVVDISIEPNDGVETHSGQSILRGLLEI